MKKEPVITSVILLAVWWVLAVSIGNDVLIPSPWQTLTYLCGLIAEKEFYLSVGASLLRVGAGFVLSLITALVFSILCGEFPVFRRYFEPVRVLTKTIPNVTYIIIAVIWLGSEGAVATVSFMILFPVFMNGFMNALDSQSRDMKDVEAVYPETLSVKIRDRILPELWPEILRTGKTAASLGFKVGVMAEILGSVQTGIGRRLNYCRMYLRTDGILAWTVVIILISICIDHLFDLLIGRHIKEEQGWKN